MQAKMRTIRKTLDVLHKLPENNMDRPNITQRHKTKKQRSRRGCLTCRSRKVKCDEQENECKNCTRLKLRCVWDTVSSFSRSTQRSRHSRACDRCRQKKLRCSSSEVAGLCSYCQQTGSPCICASGPSSGQQPSPVRPTTVSTPLGALPSKSETLRLLDAYFDGPHHFCFYTFIHPPTFRQMLENNLVPRPLLLIVLATSLRCLEPKNFLADSWADECRDLVMRNIFTHISTANLQTLLLLQRYEWHRGAHITAWFVAALATRLAQTLQLNDEPSVNRRDGEPALPVTVMETRRRLIWSCFVMDSIPDAGARPLSASIDPASIKARLPCDERSYHLGIETGADHLSSRNRTSPPDVDSLSKNSHLGVSACVIKLTILRMQILQYSSAYHPRNRTNLPSEAPWEPSTQFYGYQRALDCWFADLPKGLQLDVHAQTQNDSELISLFNLHCMFHAAYADLWRVGSFMLVNSRNNDPPTVLTSPPKPFLQRCRRGRLENAIKITNIAAKCLARLQFEPDPFIAICGCLAVRVLVIERGPDDNDCLLLTDDDIRGRIDTVFRCVKKTARWSRPVWKMLLAVSELASQHGYQADLTDIPSLSSPVGSHPISRAASPSLRTYGTYGTIQRSLATGTDELPPQPVENTDKCNPATAASPVDAIPSTCDAAQDSSNPLPEWYLRASDPLSPQTLQLESSWADGTYDRAFTEAQFDWPDGDYGLDTNYNWMYSAFGNDQNISSRFA